MSKRETLVFQSEDGQAKLEIVRASGVIGMDRSLKQLQAAQVEGESQATRYLHTISYPDLTAPVVRAEGSLQVETPEGEVVTVDFAAWPIPFEKFALLPDLFIGRWERVVYELNPHWNPAGVAEEEEKKKASSSLSE